MHFFFSSISVGINVARLNLAHLFFGKYWCMHKISRQKWTKHLRFYADVVIFDFFLSSHSISFLSHLNALVDLWNWQPVGFHFFLITSFLIFIQIALISKVNCNLKCWEKKIILYKSLKNLWSVYLCKQTKNNMIIFGNSTICK